VGKCLEGADESTFWYMKVYKIASVGLFGVVFRYYFLSC